MAERPKPRCPSCQHRVHEGVCREMEFSISIEFPEPLGPCGCCSHRFEYIPAKYRDGGPERECTYCSEPQAVQRG